MALAAASRSPHKMADARKFRTQKKPVPIEIQDDRQICIAKRNFLLHLGHPIVRGRAVGGDRRRTRGAGRLGRHVEDHPVERVQGEQVGQRLPAQVEGQVVDRVPRAGWAPRPAGTAKNAHPATRRTYVQRSMVFCGCGRRMPGNHRRNAAYHLCSLYGLRSDLNLCWSCRRAGGARGVLRADAPTRRAFGSIDRQRQAVHRPVHQADTG